eukprot:1156328-Pelagomonas_calceolata.AAC.8
MVPCHEHHCGITATARSAANHLSPLEWRTATNPRQAAGFQPSHRHKGSLCLVSKSRGFNPAQCQIKARRSTRVKLLSSWTSITLHSGEPERLQKSPSGNQDGCLADLLFRGHMQGSISWILCLSRGACGWKLLLLSKGMAGTV